MTRTERCCDPDFVRFLNEVVEKRLEWVRRDSDRWLRNCTYLTPTPPISTGERSEQTNGDQTNGDKSQRRQNISPREMKLT